MNKLLSFIGFYKEEGKLKIDWRQIYFIFSVIVILNLSYYALFKYPLEMDLFGYSSIYLIKALLVTIVFAGIYYVWGYLRLSDRVDKLERENDGDTRKKDS